MSFIHNCKLNKIKKHKVSAFQNVIMVTDDSLRAKKELMSQEAIRIERDRQFNHPQYIIHPYSNFRLAWDFIMVVIIYYLIVLESLFLAFIQTPYYKSHNYGACVIYPMNIITILDIVVNFFTGFYDSDLQKVQFDRKKVAVNYLKGKFIVHVIFAIPWYAIIKLLQFLEHKDLFGISEVFTVASVVRILRISDVLKFLNEFESHSTNHKMFWRLMRLGVITSILYHISTCLQMNLFVIFKGQYLEMTFVNQSWHIVESFSQMYASNLWAQYFKCLYRAACTLSLYGLGITSDKTAEEKILNLVLRCLGLMFRLFLVRTFVVVLNPGFTRRNYEYSNMMFIELARHKGLSKGLKQKIDIFLQYHYSYKFYEESRVLEVLSSPLKMEVLNHCYKKLIMQVKFFSVLPEEVLSDLVASLKSEVYLTGEFVEKFKETAIGMWFIRAGTVSVTSSDGIELFKLQDDDFFGEKSLFYENLVCDCNIVVEEVTEFMVLKKDLFWKIMEERKKLFLTMKYTFNKKYDSSKLVGYTEIRND